MTFNPDNFIKQKINEISSIVGNGTAISGLSGGVDSSTVTLLGSRALGERLKTYFVEDGLMREGEARKVVEIFKKLGAKVEIIDAKEEFFKALKGVVDPEAKRECVTQTFYKEVFSKLIKESGAKYLLQGTILTDIEETVAGIKRQHNVFEQLGINPQEAFGYEIIEPLKELRKDDVRKVAKALGLSKELYERIPFPGPGLATRIMGEVTPERIELIRKATSIVEEELAYTKAFQYLAILHEDRVTGIKESKRKFGYQIEVRCWESEDARVAKPTKIKFETLEKLAERIVTTLPDVVSVTYNISSKPPSTIEAI